MAEEAILKLSLKEYKAQIDDLRASLLSLESTDEQYVKTAEEIKERQSKLNEVMSIGKKNADALEGSYNYLVNQMAELKKAWRATADEAERSTLGAQIKDINDKLKGMDASIGNFQRNVGNYEGAFEKAFDTILDGVAGTNGALGQSASLVKKLIPLIKTTNTTATAGLGGIKKAIASTGIGLLIVAIGELAANWDKVVGFARDFLGIADRDAESAKRVADEIERAKKNAADVNTNLQLTINLMAAQGESMMAQLKAKESAYLEQYQKYADLAANASNHLSIMWDGLSKKEREALQEKIKTYEELRDAASENLDKTKADIKVQEAVEETAAKNMVKADEDYLKTATQLENERYQKELEAAKKYNLSTEAIEAAHQKKLKEIKDSAAKGGSKNNDSTTTTQQTQEEKDREALLNRLENYGKTELEIIDETYQKEMALIADDEEALEKLQSEWLEKRGAALIKQDKENEQTAVDSAKKIYNNANADATSTNTNTKRHNEVTMEKGSTELMDANFAADDALLSAKIANLQTYMQAYKEGSDERIAMERELTDLQAEQEDLRLQHANDTAEAEAEAQKRKKETIMTTYDSLSSSISSIMSSVSDLWQQNLEQRVENGDVTEEQAEKEFESLKALQYANAVVETAQSAMGAFSSLASIPYVGPALGAAAAAAAVAAGAVQIATIKSTKFGGTSSSVSAQTIAVPSITDEVPQVTATVNDNTSDNLQEALSNMTLEVKVTDIEAATKQSQVRVTETTW